MTLDSIKKILMILFSSLLYALAVKLFIVPSGLVTGGVTGIGLSVEHFFKIDLSGFILAINMLFLLIAYGLLGKSLFANTILASLSMPIILKTLDFLIKDDVLTQDLFLCTVFAGILIGASITICLKAGASSGGVDILCLLLKKYFRIPVSISLWVFDFLILLSQALFQGVEKVLYGLVLVLIYTIVMDRLLVIGTSKMELKIISDKTQEIREQILIQLNRGMTILSGEGGYTLEKKQIILSVVNNKELVQIEKFIHQIDPAAFIIISKVNEVSGKGFTMPKLQLDPEMKKDIK